MNNIALDLLTENFMMDTEMDELFDTLETIAPPADFVQKVMQKVAQIPLPPTPKTPWSHLDTLVVEIDRSRLM